MSILLYKNKIKGRIEPSECEEQFANIIDFYLKVETIETTEFL